MPTYDYQCRSCGFIREVVHSMLEDGPEACERCGGQLRRVVHPTGIIFRGSGFYKNDSRSTSSGSVAPATKATTATGEGAAPSTTSDGGSAGKGSGTRQSSGSAGHDRKGAASGGSGGD